jgi:CRP-like cAMP-binding protein
MDLSLFYLNNTPLDEALSPDVLATLLKGSSEKKYPAKARLFEEGTYPKGIFILRKGKVKLYQSASYDSQQIIAIHGPSEIFGYRPILNNGRYPVSAETLEPSTVVFVPRKDFLKVLGSSPQFSNLLLKYLSNEFTVWVNTISIFSRTTVKERLLLNLLVLSDRYRDKDRSYPIRINLPKADLANLVGTSNETLARMLKVLKQEKLIATRGRSLEITGNDQLRKIQDAVALFL